MRKEKPPVTLKDIEESVAEWEESLRWIAKGWDCMEEYTHDLWSRETLDRELREYGDKPVPPELTRRIAAADQYFRQLTDETGDCVWRDPQNYDRKRYWYYYRWP